MKGKNRPVIRKKNTFIIAEDNDELYFRYKMFPIISIGNLQVSNSKSEIRNSFYNDIAKIYNLPRKNIGQFLKNYSTEIIRSLVVFGEHEYIIDKIRLKTGNSF